MIMKFIALSLEDLEKVREWRYSQKEMLRTAFLLTKEMQEQFYYEIICNRQANARYWGIFEEYNNLIGMCGIENIQWENRLGEISLIMSPQHNENKMKNALFKLLNEGFNNLNLDNIYTEVYYCSRLFNFWKELDSQMVTLPNRKYYEGKYYDSLYINFNKERYNENFISKSTQTFN